MAIGFGSTLGSGAGDRIVGPTEGLPPQISIHIWTNRNSEGGGGFGRIFDRGAATFALIQNGGTSSDYAFYSNNATNWTFARPSSSVWAPIGLAVDTTSSANNPAIYLSGSKLTVGSGLTKNDFGSSWVTTAETWCIGNRPTDNIRAWDGSLAEFAVWNVILTDTEFAALQRGASPDLIRPEARIHYLPAEREGWLNKSGPRWSVTGTKSPLPHPIVRQTAPTRRLWTAAAGGTSHDLVGLNAVQANAASTAAISQAHALSAQASAQANSASAAAITQSHALAAATSVQANTAATGVVTQTHALTGVSETQPNTAAQGAISQGAVHDLTAAATSQANAGSTGAISQAHILVSAPSIQDNIAAASAIVQAHVLAASSVTQSNSASSGAISAGDNVLVSIVKRVAVFRRSKSVTIRFN